MDTEQLTLHVLRAKVPGEILLTDVVNELLARDIWTVNIRALIYSGSKPL